MSLAFFLYLLAGRMPGIGYANDHGISLLVAALAAGAFCALELSFVHGMKFLPGLRLVHRKVTQPSAKMEARWGDSGRLAMIGLPALPAGGGTWIAYWLGMKLGIGFGKIMLALSTANAVYFWLYFKYAGGIAWYIAGGFAIVAVLVALPKFMSITVAAFRRLAVRFA